MSDQATLTMQVAASLNGQRLDQASAALFPEYSRARLQKWIRDGALTVDGHRAKPSHKLSGGEFLQLTPEVEIDDEIRPQNIPLDVVYADREIIIIDKPASLVVHPAAGHADGTLQNALLHFDPELAAIPRAGIVHRLDKDTTGLMVVARTLKAHACLVEQLQARSVGRIYETVVHGLADPSGTVDAPIGRHPRDRKRMAVVRTGKPAVSHFRRLTPFGHFSHLEVSLETGRTHQIRVHMQHIGLPVVGDPLYGRRSFSRRQVAPDVYRFVQGFARQALHARTLRLQHPASGRRRVFHAPLPADLGELIAVLGAGDAA